MPRLDREIIDARIKKIQTAARKLDRFRNMSFEQFEADSDNSDIAERNMEVAIEAMLDIGNHIIAVQGLEKPEDYYDIFIIMGKHSILPKDFTEKIAPLSGLRNRIIHGYLTIDYKLLLQKIKDGLGDFERFAKEILLFLQRTP